MLAKSKRLTTRQFNEVMEKGRVAHSSLFTLRFLIGQGEARVAAVAPQKIARKAVTRNRIRRRMYEAVKPFADSIVPGARLIIFAKEDVSKTKFNELAAEIRALITRSDLVISN